MHELKQSTIYLVRLLVSQAEECEISVTVSKKTRSDGHKFKVCVGVRGCEAGQAHSMAAGGRVMVLVV